MFVPHMHFSICYSVVSRSCCVYTAELVLHNFLTSYELLCSGLQQRRQNEQTWYETQNWALNITFSHTCPNIFIQAMLCAMYHMSHMPKHFHRIHTKPQEYKQCCVPPNFQMPTTHQQLIGPYVKHYSMPSLFIAPCITSGHWRTCEYLLQMLVLQLL